MTDAERHAEARRQLLLTGSLTAAGRAIGLSRQSASLLVQASKSSAPLALTVGVVNPPTDVDPRDLNAVLVALRRTLEEAGVTVVSRQNGAWRTPPRSETHD